MGRIVRVISKDASVVCSAINGKDIVSRIEEIHKTSAVVTAALGRLAMGTSLMGFGLKGKDDSITVKMDGDGPTGALICVSDSMGNVKAYVQNPVVELPLNDKGKLDVRAAVGSNGTLSVVKDMGLKEPYCGQVPIVSGEIAEDITNYLAVSEQVPSVCALGVLVNPDLTVNCAGGFLIQLLPFAPESAIDQIEKNINGMESVTKLICGGMTTEAIAMKALEGLEPNVLDDFEVNYRCDCSRERVENALISLGRAELEDLSKDGGTDVECHFCDKKYHFTPEEILGLIKE
ncbi:Hsp33 family molecular chaperone HslO [Ruminococcus sp. AM54-1NS]|jgi:molecular chaperone Hsp33|nr:Hsp33 family molecular chaperone HslO [Ruminococcus bicirculans (ex Wegman et al. 2014)]RGF90705.1 Hsp33 family molecular chaperone HslO [Ruminococcus sp. AM54-1NS]